MMKQNHARLLCLVLSLAASSAPAAFEDFEKCYQRYGQLETTESSGKKVTVYKEQAEVAAQCNETVLARAKTEKKPETMLELAGVIGRNSNWASAMPVYVLAAKQKPKAMCVHKDVLYSLEDALARPADEKQAVSADLLMTTCWPNGKDKFIAFLTANQNGYVKQNVCRFLKTKKALPADKKELCES